MPQEIKISTSTVLEAFLILGLFYFLFLLRDLILLVFVAFILMSVLSPAVDYLQKRGVPRFLNILFLYLLLISFLILFIQAVANPLVGESQSFISSFPQVLENFLRSIKLPASFDINQWSAIVTDLFGKFFGQIISAPLFLVKIGAEVFSGVVALLSVLVITFYLLLDGEKIKKFLALFFPLDKREQILLVVNTIERKLGDWLRGELVLMFVVGLLTFVGLTLLDIKFALPLAVLAGLLEIVPNVGPIFSMLPSLIIGLAESPLKALAVVVLFLFVQQSENNLLVPLIMKKAVGLHPLFIILALIIGGKLLGAAGVILAVPLAVVFWVIFTEFFATTKNS